ncbi:protein-tyrosine phosphatase-like protein [Bisporella sp. PMI_857]|nr:protein-tyrosine phosphatase-like protein [Bisporella sp. PMI_857]
MEFASANKPLSRIPGDDELYVGGIFGLSRPDMMQEAGITHVVSVLRYDFANFVGWDKYEHLEIDALDVEDENLLGEFEKTGSFIENGLREGKDGRKGAVLVHCAVGKSRSVTVCIAFLLRKYNCTVESALKLIQKVREIAEPNEGFMKQLELYKEMGCPRDIDGHPRYQRWLYQREVDLALAAGMAPDTLRFEDEQQQEQQAGGEKQVELRCRKCRQTLATTPYLDSHLPNSSIRPATIQSSRISSPTTNLPPAPSSNVCTHHFLHPLSWMRTELEQGLLSGKLECPNAKCKAKLGQYAWQGMRCSCGAWICPAFSLQKGRIDEVTLKAGVGQGAGRKNGFRVADIGAAGIRVPPNVRGPEKM